MSGAVLEFMRPRRLAELEQIVSRGQRAFEQIGRALKEILKDHEIAWKTYGTFEDYCKSRFGMSRPRVAQILAATQAVDNIVTMVTKLPTSERVARALVPLEPEQQRDVWKKAALDYDQPTAANVRQVAIDLGYVKPKAPPPLQEEGRFYFNKGSTAEMARSLAGALTDLELRALADALTVILVKREAARK